MYARATHSSTICLLFHLTVLCFLPPSPDTPILETSVEDLSWRMTVRGILDQRVRCWLVNKGEIEKEGFAEPKVYVVPLPQTFG